MVLKTLYDQNTDGKAIDFIRQNKKEILANKKAFFKTEPLSIDIPSLAITKQSPVELEEGQFYIVGNSVGFMDSHRDVSLKGSWTKTVNERGGIVPILADHERRIKAIIATNLGARIDNVPIQDLGFDMAGTTEVLGAVIEPFGDAKNLYDNDQIKQHSVGLQYVKIALAVNDPEDEEGYKEWVTNIDKVINREIAEEFGFFFPVYEQKLIEISAVVFGSNPYTPAFSKSLKIEPQKHSKVNEPTKKKTILHYLNQ